MPEISPNNRAVIYARYSSDLQREESIDAQVRACREYAARRGFVVVGEYKDEAVSGKGSKTALRREYQRLMRDCDKDKFSVILVHKYDWVARNLGEHVNLESRLKEKSITLIATAQDFGNTNEAKIMRALMWSLSEYYIDNLAEETKKGLRETALKGLHTGGYPPFGYDIINQQYIVNPLEAGYVQKIFDAAANKEGFTQLIEEMERSGIVGKRGKPIKYTQIYEMLRNEKYTGVYLYSPTEAKKRAERRGKSDAIRIENALPVIISKDQFKEVQRIMKERAQTGRKSNYLCSGLVYCECGAKMHGTTSKRKGYEYRYFVCSKHCGKPSLRAEEVDRAALQYLKDLLSPKNQQKITEALRTYQSGEGTRMEEFMQALQKRIQQKQKEYDTLVKNLSSGVLPEDVINDLGVRLHQIKEKIESLKDTKPPKDFTADQIKNWLESLKNNPDEKAVQLLIERIDIKNKTDINITSTLQSVLGEIGCGGGI